MPTTRYTVRAPDHIVVTEDAWLAEIYSEKGARVTAETTG